MKKYKSKSDELRGKVSPEYAKFVRDKQRRKQWDEKIKSKVIKTLPKKIAVNFNNYNFTNIPKQKITSLYIYGNVGTGKSVLSAYYYVFFLKTMYIKSSAFKKTYYFVTFSKLMDDLQNDYKEANVQLQKCITCDLLVLDEFGAKKITEYVYDKIYLIVNERYLNQLPTIINSNDTLSEIRSKFNDERIVRRIDEDYTKIKKSPFKK